MNGFYRDYASGVQADAHRYLMANGFLQALNKHKHELKYDDASALRKQALSGDIIGAYQKLQKILYPDSTF